MFSVGWPEFTIVLIVALIVIGPRDLPKTLNQIGKWVGAARRMSREFQRHVDDMVRDSELGELKDGVNTLKRTTNVRSAIENTIDPDGSLRKSVSGRLDDDDPKPTQTLASPTKPAASNGALEKPESGESAASATAKSAPAKLTPAKPAAAPKAKAAKPKTAASKSAPKSTAPKSSTAKKAGTKTATAAKTKPAAPRKRTSAARKPKDAAAPADAPTDA